MNETYGFTQIAPSPRYGHTAVYVELTEPDLYTNISTKRKYMYMYGGVAYDCIDGCDDF